MIKLLKKIRNYFLCLKYPFLKIRNVFSDKFLGYSYTEYDWIPLGWRKAFGKQLLKELREALIKEGRLKEFRFTQIKEKWGELCLYNNGVGKYSEYVINKYEILSLAYCQICGKPVRYVSTGYWLEYICQDCYDKLNNKDDYRRLTKEDIPYSIVYDKDKKIKINYKDVYGLDFNELWKV